MLSVVIPTHSSEEGLARTLASLVPAAAEGMVREVIVVVDDTGSRETGRATVADAAGCVIATSTGSWDARVRAGVAAVRRGTWVLCLPSAVLLEGDWFREVSAFIERAERRGVAPDAVGTFRLEVDAYGWRARLAETVIDFCNLLGMPTEEQGLLMTRRLWDEVLAPRGRLARHTDLVRRLGRRRIRRLRVSAVAAIVDGAAPPTVTARGILRHLMASLGLSALVPDVR
jgi:hypothetical protein